MKMVRGLPDASFALVMYTLAVVGLLLLTLPTIIILIASLTNSYSLKFPPPATRSDGMRRCWMRHNCTRPR